MEKLIYDYLALNCIGYDNRIKARTLMKKFNIKDNKTFRSYIQEIRKNPEFIKLIGSEAGQNGGYWIINSKEEFETTVHHHYARAVEMMNTCKILRKKGKEYARKIRNR